MDTRKRILRNVRKHADELYRKYYPLLSEKLFIKSCYDAVFAKDLYDKDIIPIDSVNTKIITFTNEKHRLDIDPASNKKRSKQHGKV